MKGYVSNDLQAESGDETAETEGSNKATKACKKALEAGDELGDEARDGSQQRSEENAEAGAAKVVNKDCGIFVEEDIPNGRKDTSEVTAGADNLDETDKGGDEELVENSR